MSLMDWAAWCVIAGLSFISIGGLLLWAYGDSLAGPKDAPFITDERSIKARRSFMGLIVYSVALIILGLGFLVQGTLFVLA